MSTSGDHHQMQLDSHILTFLKACQSQDGSPLWTFLPTSAREFLRNCQQSVPVANLPVDMAECTLLTGPTGRIGVRIVRPQGVSGVLPAIVYFHGGGWMLGDKETHDRLVREIATGVHAAVVFVEYARSPEAKYLVATEQAYAATRWVAEHGASTGIDPSHLTVAGEGTGGTLATVTTLLAKERGGPPIDFQVLLYPVTDADFETPSYREFGAEGHWLTSEMMRWFWESYVPVAERKEFTVSPLRTAFAHKTPSERNP